MESELLTTAQLAQRLRVAPRTCKAWRKKAPRVGPDFIILGGTRAVRYRVVDVDAWLAAGAVGSAETHPRDSSGTESA